MDPRQRSDDLAQRRIDPKRPFLEEIGTLRRQVKNLEREVRHLKSKLHDYQMRSPWASEEEEMDEYINQVVGRVRLAASRPAREDGIETNGDAGPLD